MAELDDLTAWFHALAELPHDELIRQASPDTISRLQTHAARNILGYPIRSAMNPEDFAATVLALRHSEGSWNRATMAAILKAEDLHNAGQKAEAAASLEAFAKTCPWLLFQEVALDQGSHYK
jgi:hypothetical protein